jgi:hypothetical protein
MRRSFVLVVVLAATVWAAVPLAQEPPVTMGSLVMRMARSDDSVRPVLLASATHPDAGIRAVTARIAGTGGHAAMADSLIAALRNERDPFVAAEQVRALLLVGTPEAEAAVETHLGTAEAPAVVAYALRLARVRPLDLIERLPRLVERVGDAAQAVRLVPAVMMAAQQHPTHRAALLRVWLGAAPPAAWRAALDTLARPPADDAPDVAVLRDALSGSNADVRRETVWTVVRWIADGHDLPAALADAAAAGHAAVESTWESFGRELVARQRRGAKVSDRTALVAAAGGQFVADILAVAQFDDATRDERRAAAAHLPSQSRVPGPVTIRLGPTVDRYGRLSPMKTVDPIWPGLLEGLLQAAGCPLSSERRVGALRLAWDANGRPREGSIDRMDLSPECATALGALAMVSQADADRVVEAGMEQWLLLPVFGEFTQCAGNHVLSRSAVVTPARGGRAPIKIRDVRPAIPPIMRAQRIQATTVLDATISAEGCVASAELFSGGVVAFNVEAFRAALAWRYEAPRTQDGPVAVNMLLTFSFTMN